MANITNLHSTNSSEILKIIYIFKPKSEGIIDRISAKTVNILAKFIADSLVNIINIMVAIYPWKLKLAEIKPIPKEGDKHLLCNHKPIWLISNLAKIYE